MDATVFDASAPVNAAERLFAGIERPKTDRFTLALSRYPVWAGLAFTTFFVTVVVGLKFAQLAMGATDPIFAQLPSDSIIALLIGGALFPSRTIWLPALTYAVIFALVTAASFYWVPNYVPLTRDGLRLLMFSFVGNGLAAYLAARFARMLFRRFESTYANERADLALALGATGAYLVTGTVFLGLALHLAYPLQAMAPGFDPYVGWFYGILRVARIALGAGIFLLCFSDTPSWTDARKLALPLAGTLTLGVLSHYGIAMHPTIDINLFILGVIIFLPYYRATLFSMVQTPVHNHFDLILEIISLVTGVILFLELAWRHLSHFQASRRRDALTRLERIQAFAGVGYFVADLDRGKVYVDDVGASFLNTANRIDFSKELLRISPADQPSVVAAMKNKEAESAAFTFALSPGRIWSAEQEPQYISTFAWYETLWDGRRIAYGATQDITNERRTEENLRATLAELSRQQTAQVQMFSIISHELRTPASVQTLLIEEMDNGAAWSDIGPKLASVNAHLLSVLGDMRQAVQPEQNLPIVMESFLPHEKLEAVRNTFAIMAAQKAIAFDIVTRGPAREPRLG
ncbi:MAG: sensor histidine kinase, partial [Rhodobacteraceae bacterium]|nr:sensor histidine kinase [Paracoccaceae bacterium]